MGHKILYLPCFVYVMSFASILLLYQMGWSDLYPRLNGFLLVFLFSTIALSLILALLQKKYLKINNYPVNLRPSFVKKALYFICIGYTLEFLYEKGVPVVTTFLNSSYSYDDFNGIPTFHVILSTFNIFFSILMFDNYLSNKNRINLFHFLTTLLPYILVMNRGAFMIVFSAVIFLFLMRLESINIKSLIKAFAIFGLVLYLFGVVGNVRQQQSKEDKEYLLRIGGATDSFIESGVPSEFYWSYIYIISPMGNLQNIVDQKEDEFDMANFGAFTTTQLFPDFISKRLAKLMGHDDLAIKEASANYLVTVLLNAPTMYYIPYFLLGRVGVIIMYIIVMCSSLIYPYLIKGNSRYHLTAIASLNSIILLSAFNNMWYATGTILLWPIIFSLLEKIKLR